MQVFLGIHFPQLVLQAELTDPTNSVVEKKYTIIKTELGTPFHTEETG